MKRLRATALALGAIGASIAAPIAANQPKPDFAIAPYQGAYQPQGVDERGIWMIADEDERILRDSRAMIGDPALNAYVRSILCRAVGQDRCGSARIYILRAPIFNASMAPNGTMRVYSGLLLRARNEAELAAVLGHEFAHFELRHSLLGFKRARTGADLLAWTALFGAVAETYGNGTGTSVRDTQISIYGSLQRYNRDQERQADTLGFGYMASAHYRASAAADVWRSVMNEADGGAAARGQRSARYDKVAFMASHPTNLERADTLSLMANRVPGGEFDGAKPYAAALKPWLHEFLQDQLKLNDFGGTEYLLGRLAGDEWTPELLLARGDLYRLRGNPRDLVSAAGFYRQTLAGDASLVEAYRGLGLSLLRSGAVPEGRTALASYLAARPDCSDAAMLRSLLK